MEKNVTITVNGFNLHLILGKTKSEWKEQFGNEDPCGEALWDFPLEELLDGTIDIDEENYYYLINGRVYETTIEAE